MKKLLVIGLLILLSLGAQPLLAQNRIGIEGSLVAPLGDLNDFLTVGYGMGIFFDIMFTPNVGGKIDAAFNQFGNKNLTIPSTTWEARGYAFPVRLGVNYYFDDPEDSRPYAGFMIGLYNRTFKGVYASDYIPPDSVLYDSDSKSRFGIAPQIGYLFEIDDEKIYIDASVSYDIWFGDRGFYGNKRTFSYLRVNAGLSWAIGKSDPGSEN